MKKKTNETFKTYLETARMSVGNQGLLTNMTILNASIKMRKNNATKGIIDKVIDKNEKWYLEYKHYLMWDTPLKLACEFKNEEIFIYLLEKGVNSNKKITLNGKKRSVAEYLSRRGTEKMIEKAIEKNLIVTLFEKNKLCKITKNKAFKEKFCI